MGCEIEDEEMFADRAASLASICLSAVCPRYNFELIPMNKLPSISMSKVIPGKTNSGPTAQEIVWNGDLGRDYTDRNMFDTDLLDELWLRRRRKKHDYRSIPE